MPSLLLNQALISNLNQLSSIPLPICRLIIDGIMNSHVGAEPAINENQIANILRNQQIHNCEFKKGINSLKYLLKIAIKEDFPIKKIALFLTENTCLSQQFAEYFCQKYQQTKELPVQPPSLACLQKISWGCYNLRQDVSGQGINKIYMKTQISTLEEGKQKHKVVVTTLPEFKLLINELNEVGAALR